MPTIVQINSFDSGSTGNIAKQINTIAEKSGYKTYFLFGRYWKGQHEQPDTHIKIGIRFDCFLHLIKARLFDALGLGSRYATKKLIQLLEQLQPDIVHLHNIHGYYVNYPILFNYFKEHNIRVIWTLHDCWTMTGHCSHFDLIKCDRWKTQCHDCPIKNEYPKSIFLDRSRENYQLKKSLFTSLGNRLTLIPVSYWLEDIVKESFFKDSSIHTIHNGIALDTFTPQSTESVISKYQLENKTVLLGVAAPWTARKGFNDFLKLRESLPERYAIIMVGLSPKQIAELPDGIIGIERTQNVNELAQLYSAADIFINTTYEDNYPTVNLEAIACGTPVITYRTGGSPESVTPQTGRVVEQGNMEQLVQAIRELETSDRNQMRLACRTYAEANFDKQKCFQEYIDLYNNILNKE